MTITIKVYKDWKTDMYFSFIEDENENTIYISKDCTTKKEAWEDAIKNIPMPKEYA